jgi:hypothetical protein
VSTPSDRWRSGANERSVGGIVAAVVIHAAIIAAIIVWAKSGAHSGGNTRTAGGRVSGLSSDATGMPATHLRNVRLFKIVDATSRKPLVHAEVRDLMSDEVALSTADGAASLEARPGAQMRVRVTMAGYIDATVEVANRAAETTVQVVALHRVRNERSFEPYSARIATSGSTRVARNDGTSVAPSPATIIAATAVAHVGRSSGLTP